jgi:outer membrane murein-binding lipoprotein Lpp
MFDLQVHRKLWLAAATAGLLILAACSNQATKEAAATPPKAQTPKAQTPKAEAPKAASVASKAPEPTTMVTVPKGTAISATVGQTLTSNKNHAGDTIAAKLTTPVQVEGKTVIPKGAKVVGRVVKVKSKEMKVTLASVELHGKSYELETNSVAQSAKNQAKNSPKDSAQAKSKTATKDVTTVPAQSQLSFKLAKAVIIPVKG